MRRGAFSAPAADGGWIKVPRFGNAGTGEQFLIEFERFHRDHIDISAFARTAQEKRISTRDIHARRSTEMPASVHRHNLARLRQVMHLTQSDLAGMILRSPATIKAVEIGKLAL